MNKNAMRTIDDFIDTHDMENIFDDLINGEVIGTVEDSEETKEVAKKIETYFRFRKNSIDIKVMNELTSEYAYENQRQAFLWGIEFIRMLLSYPAAFPELRESE